MSGKICLAKKFGSRCSLNWKLCGRLFLLKALAALEKQLLTFIFWNVTYLKDMNIVFVSVFVICDKVSTVDSCRVASMRRGLGLPCTGHSCSIQCQWPYQRTKLSPAATCVCPSGKSCFKTCKIRYAVAEEDWSRRNVRETALQSRRG